MAHHKSCLKRIRQDKVKRLRNRYQGKTTRNMIREFTVLTDKAEAEKIFPQVVSKIDKLVKSNIIHKNKAGHLKSQLQNKLNSL